MKYTREQIEAEAEWCENWVKGEDAADMLRQLLAENDALREDADRYRWLSGYCCNTSEHWGGRWSIVIEGPAPETNDSEDDFDKAIYAARKEHP